MPRPVPKPPPKKKQKRPGRLTGAALRDSKRIAWGRAGGVCEKCPRWLRWTVSDGVVLGTGFYEVEFHHIVKRSQMGGDEPENLMCLCDSCHRKEHN